MKEKLSALSSVITAAFASICCIGPLVLVALGLSGAGWLPALVKFRPLFIAATLFLLIWAWWVVLKKGKCHEAESKKSKLISKDKIILLVVTLVVVTLLLFPYILGIIQRG